MVADIINEMSVQCKNLVSILPTEKNYTLSSYGIANFYIWCFYKSDLTYVEYIYFGSIE